MSIVDEFADFVGDVALREVALPYGPAQVWDVGEGRPLVLLHGIACSRRVFFRVVPLLARTRRVIVPALRGEDMPAPRARHEDLVADLGALLEALALDDVTLAGVSFGGTVALAYAARHDPRVADVVVQGTFAGFRLRPFDRVVLGLSRVVPAALGARYFAWRVARGPEAALLRETQPGLDVLMAEWSAKTPFRTLARRTRVIAAMDLSDAIRSIRVPLTIAHGARDKVVPRFCFERLCALRPDARIVLWDDVGHNAALAAPEKYVALFDE